MPGDQATVVIEQDTLHELIETSRAEAPRAHTIARPSMRELASERPPSALRGLLMLVAAAIVLRELVRWLFF